MGVGSFHRRHLKVYEKGHWCYFIWMLSFILFLFNSSVPFGWMHLKGLNLLLVERQFKIEFNFEMQQLLVNLSEQAANIKINIKIQIQPKRSKLCSFYFDVVECWCWMLNRKNALNTLRMIFAISDGCHFRITQDDVSCSRRFSDLEDAGFVEICFIFKV